MEDIWYRLVFCERTTSNKINKNDTFSAETSALTDSFMETSTNHLKMKQSTDSLFLMPKKLKPLRARLNVIHFYFILDFENKSTRS